MTSEMDDHLIAQLRTERCPWCSSNGASRRGDQQHGGGLHDGRERGRGAPGGPGPPAYRFHQRSTRVEIGARPAVGILARARHVMASTKTSGWSGGQPQGRRGHRSHDSHAGRPKLPRLCWGPTIYGHRHVERSPAGRAFSSARYIGGGFRRYLARRFTEPPLTTVRLSLKDLAENAFHALLRDLDEQGGAKSDRKLETRLIVRETPARRRSAQPAVIECFTSRGEASSPHSDQPTTTRDCPCSTVQPPRFLAHGHWRRRRECAAPPSGRGRRRPQSDRDHLWRRCPRRRNLHARGQENIPHF